MEHSYRTAPHFHPAFAGQHQSVFARGFAGRQVGHHRVVVRGAKMPGAGHLLRRIGQFYLGMTVDLTGIRQDLILRRKVYDLNAHHIGCAYRNPIGLSTPNRKAFGGVHHIACSEFLPLLVVDLQLHLHMAEGRLQHHVAFGHIDDLAGAVVAAQVGAGDHLPATEGGALPGDALTRRQGDGLVWELAGNILHTLGALHALEGDVIGGAVHHHLWQRQLQTVFDLLVKETGVQAAVGPVVVDHDLARRDHRLLSVDLGVQLHRQGKIQTVLAAQPLNGHVQARAVRPFGDGQAAPGAAAAIHHVRDGFHHGLPVVQQQGEVDVVVMVVDKLLQAGGHLLLHPDGIGGGMGRGLLGLRGAVVGLAVLGGVPGEQFAGLDGVLPGDQGAAPALQRAFQLRQLGFDLLFRLLQLRARHPEDHRGVIILALGLLYRREGRLQRRHLVGGALTDETTAAVSDECVEKVNVIGVYLAHVGGILIGDELRGGG